MTWIPENHVDGIRKIELCPAEDKDLIYRMEDDRGVHEVHAGLDHWIYGTTTMTGAIFIISMNSPSQNRS